MERGEEMTKEEHEQKGYDRGVLIGFKDAAGILEERAVGLFKKRNLEGATKMMEFSDEILKVSVKKREEYDMKWPN